MEITNIGETRHLDGHPKRRVDILLLDLISGIVVVYKQNDSQNLNGSAINDKCFSIPT